MLGLPTRKELQEIIDNGAKCQFCKTAPAQIGSIMGAPCITPCDACLKKQSQEAAERKKREDNSMGSNNLASVWELPNGKQVPVNEKGNVISSVNKNSYKKQQRPGERPVEF